MNIKELFHIKKGDIISIVGSGGKTTLLLSLCSKLRDEYCVMATTSTKMYKPDRAFYDTIYTDVNSFLKSGAKKKGITVISGSIDLNNNKLIGIGDNDLNKLIEYFDIVVIEADGSRNMPLKGWKSHEPPVLLKTNKTIGIIPIGVIGRKVNESFIYGYDEFKELVGNKVIDFDAVAKICTNEGLFKNSHKEKYLFINQTDDSESIEKARNLAKYLRERIPEINICFGSLKKDVYYEY